MNNLIEKFVHQKFDKIVVEPTEDGGFIGYCNDYKLFLYDTSRDTLFFSFYDFNSIKHLFDISDFRTVHHIKKVFKEKGIPFSIFLPILNTGIYWYDLESYV